MTKLLEHAVETVRSLPPERAAVQMSAVARQVSRNERTTSQRVQLLCFREVDTLLLGDAPLPISTWQGVLC